MSPDRPVIGGQAVIEGVMMRSPKAMAIVCRKPSGELAVKEEVWRSVTGRLKFLRWPFLRGTVVFVEALVNGVQALAFSANQALDEEDGGPLSSWALAGTIAAAFALGIGLFVVAPHFLTLVAGRIWGQEINIQSVAFHVVDGLIKVAFFLAYIAGISLMKDIRRVFMYHGAEHMSIHAYERGEDLTVENARRHPTLHPRCGTAFLLLTLLISIALFAAVFPFVPKPFGQVVLDNLTFIGIKILLLMPIAGLAYEFIRLSSRKAESRWMKPLLWPGLALQKLTTRRPTDDQIEVALAALKCALRIEEAAR